MCLTAIKERFGYLAPDLWRKYDFLRPMPCSGEIEKALLGHQIAKPYVKIVNAAAFVHCSGMTSIIGSDIFTPSSL